MNKRTLLISLACVVSVRAAHPAICRAHQLDEYLQATRLSVERGRIGVEIDLTPGVNVAPQVFALIDTDRDGQISPAEREAYARLVLTSVALSVDGRTVPVALIGQRFPDFGDMALGVGTIRLRGAAAFPAAAAGRHEIYYCNTHQSETGVYLVNTLVPADEQIQITEQRRDYAQHELTVRYRVLPDWRWSSFWSLVAALAMAGILAVRGGFFSRQAVKESAWFLSRNCCRRRQIENIETETRSS